MADILFTDAGGPVTLSNLKPPPADRFFDWTPDALPIGPSKAGLGTGIIHKFTFREDYLVAFQIRGIPNTELDKMLRLQTHLLDGYLVRVECDHEMAATYVLCALAPDTEPTIEFSDNTELEYTFGVVLKAATPAEEPFYPPNPSVCADGAPPSSDYEMTLLDVTTLAEVMALSHEVNDVGGGPGGADDYGNLWPAEVAGKRMINAAGLTLVNDPTSANGVRYLLLGSAPNPGEAGYGYSNIQTLFPADTYRDFCCSAIQRKMEGGACLGGTIELYTPNFFQGISIIRDPGSGEIKLTSYLASETSGDFLTPLTGATAYTDIIDVSMHWVLTNRQDIYAGEAVSYDVAIDITVKVNGVASPTRSLTGSVEATRFESDPAKDIAPWIFLTGQSFGDDASEIHGWGFKV